MNLERKTRTNAKTMSARFVKYGGTERDGGGSGDEGSTLASYPYENKNVLALFMCEAFLVKSTRPFLYGSIS